MVIFYAFTTERNVVDSSCDQGRLSRTSVPLWSCDVQEVEDFRCGGGLDEVLHGRPVWVRGRTWHATPGGQSAIA